MISREPAILIFFMAVMLHELGHIIHFWAIKKHAPFVKFKIWGIFPQITDQLTILEKIENVVVAFFSGYIPVYLLNDSGVYGAYILACSLDLVILLSLLWLGFKYGFKTPLKEVPEGTNYPIRKILKTIFIDYIGGNIFVAISASFIGSIIFNCFLLIFFRELDFGGLIPLAIILFCFFTFVTFKDMINDIKAKIHEANQRTESGTAVERQRSPIPRKQRRRNKVVLHSQGNKETSI